MPALLFLAQQSNPSHAMHVCQRVCMSSCAHDRYPDSSRATYDRHPKLECHIVRCSASAHCLSWNAHDALRYHVLGRLTPLPHRSPSTSTAPPLPLRTRLPQYAELWLQSSYHIRCKFSRLESVCIYVQQTWARSSFHSSLPTPYRMVRHRPPAARRHGNTVANADAASAHPAPAGLCRKQW